ncbi:MAG: tetratricopeptide repeat protein [Vulcanimicrobiaceae bacterium]
MQPSPARGLPPRIYVPILVVVGVIFIAVMGYLLALGFGVTGSVFGQAVRGTAGQAGGRSQATNVEGGGPPPAVALQLNNLRREIAAHPNDDVALTQLGDLYLAVGKYTQAIPFYVRALRANPGNIAAKSGLSEARQGVAQERAAQ